MPQPRHTAKEAADALLGVAPLITRWTERLLANHEPRLTLAQFLTLRAVASGIDSGTALARSAGVSGPAVSQLVAGLVDVGLLVRTESATDRRRSALALSPPGEAALASVNSALRGSVAAVLSELPRPEIDALVRAMPHVQAVLAGVEPPRRPAPPPGPPGPHPPPRGHDLRPRHN